MGDGVAVSFLWFPSKNAYPRRFIDSAVVNGTSYMVSINLAGNATYYWRVTADNACGNSTSPVWRFKTVDLQCSSPNVAIPDNNPAGVTNDLVLANGGTIDDLDVSVQMTHSWVGDVIFTLQHVDTGTTVTFYDRPGVPASTFGCSGDNVDATLDDEAATLVEDECGAGVPAIDGTFIPNNLLAAFDGEDRAGTWRITASDLASGDTGTLNTWCVAASTVGNAGIGVSGETEAVGVVGQTITYTLQITNTGDISDTFDLTLSSSDWATSLSASTVGPLAPGAGTSVEVYVTIGEGSSDMVDVTVTSQFDPLVFATVTYTTSTYLVYLPVILKP
jgi:subtilisin-like proprotein convertase family protein